MKVIKEYYAELISLTQLFLLREYSLQDVKGVDPSTLEFFQGKQKNAVASAPKKAQPTPPPLPISQPVQMPPRVLSSSPVATTRPIESRKEPTPVQPLPPPQTEATPPSPPPIVQSKEVKSKGFALEPLSKAAVQDNSEWWALCQTLFPDLIINKAIPDDDLAQKNKNAWLRSQEMSAVIILSFQDNEQQLAFLRNIAQAISLRLASTQIISASQIEKENGWENILNSSQLRLIIAGDYGLYMHPKLMQYYREVPQQGKHFLNQTPLLLLSDLSLYLKEPQLKPLLWRAICNEFVASQSSRSAPK